MQSTSHQKFSLDPAGKSAGPQKSPPASARELSTPEKLPPGRWVYVKDVARLAGICPATVCRRIRLAQTNPDDPRALPAAEQFGRPYRIARPIAAAFLGGLET